MTGQPDLGTAIGCLEHAIYCERMARELGRAADPAVVIYARDAEWFLREAARLEALEQSDDL